MCKAAEGFARPATVVLLIYGVRSATAVSARLLEHYRIAMNSVNPVFCSRGIMLRILVADDHDVIKRGLRALLESKPEWTVVAQASNGREAVEQAEIHKPDVAVLDISMPKLSGLEAARRIHKV